jgi:hypothetical protein
VKIWLSGFWKHLVSTSSVEMSALELGVAFAASWMFWV